MSPVQTLTRRVLLIDSIGRLGGGTQMMADEILHRADPARFSVALACLTDGKWAQRVRAEGFTVQIVARTRWRNVANIVAVARHLRDIILLTASISCTLPRTRRCSMRAWQAAGPRCP